MNARSADVNPFFAHEISMMFMEAFSAYTMQAGGK